MSNIFESLFANKVAELKHSVVNDMAKLGLTCKEAFEVFSQNETLRLQQENDQLKKELRCANRKLSYCFVPFSCKLTQEQWDLLWARDETPLWECIEEIERVLLSNSAYAYLWFFPAIFECVYKFICTITNKQAPSFAAHMADQLANLLWDASTTVDERELYPPIHHSERPFVMCVLTFPWLEQTLKPKIVQNSPPGPPQFFNRGLNRVW